MKVIPVPVLTDNYAYLVVDEASGSAVVVDPSQHLQVLSELQQRALTLEQIWLTHHHWDHVGGVGPLCDALGPVPIYASAHDLGERRIPGQTHGLQEGEPHAFQGREVRVLEIPGHTLGAIAYAIDGELFSGDTLFVAGCGRVFEGTMAMMQQSLEKLRQLPPETRVWCGHEYTLQNLRYALTVEPDSEAVRAALAQAERVRSEGRPTVPSTIGDELLINPFLRFDAPGVARGRGEVETFTALREGKDRF